MYIVISLLHTINSAILFLIPEAIANMDDDFIMLEIYDDTQAELQAKNKFIEKEKEKVKYISD